MSDIMEETIMGEKRKPATICIQSGWKPKNGEPRVLPIYQSTTFKYETSEQMGRLFDLEEDGYFYTRLANPTNDAVAEKICELEGGVAAMLTSSGQAANYYAAFNICNAGDHIISAATIYGGTSNLFTVTMKKQGIDVTLVDPDAPEEEIEKTLAYIAGRDIRAVSERVMHILFQTLAMRYEFSLSDLTQPGLE